VLSVPQSGHWAKLSRESFSEEGRMRVWGRRPPLVQLVAAAVVAIGIGVALSTVLPLVVAGGVTAVLIYLGLMLWIGFSRRTPP
jgi:hypothetical protein